MTSSFHCASVLLPEGWASNARLTVTKGAFARIERDVPAGPADQRIAVALPGMPNVHSHGFQRGMAGLTEYRGPAADNFWSWRELMYRFVARMTPEDLQAVTAFAYVEMLESGFTRVGEFHYVHHDPEGRAYTDPAEMAARVCAAAEETEMGLSLFPVFYAHGNFGGAAPTPGQRRFVTDLDAFTKLLDGARRALRALPDAHLGVAPHSLRAVTPAQLREVISLGGAGPIHIHAAEQWREVEECVQWSGARPVEWLLDHAPVDRRWCLVHATHLNASELSRLAASGAVAGFCPVTEANLGDGIAPARGLIDAGGAFGIGTDSNVLIGVSEELRQLEYCQRLRDRVRNVIGAADSRSTGRALLGGAVRGGARSLGIAAGIVEGASADFVSLDVGAADFAHRHEDALLDTFIFSGGGGGIDGVWRAGRQVVARGRHVKRDSIDARYRAALGHLLELSK